MRCEKVTLIREEKKKGNKVNNRLGTGQRLDKLRHKLCMFYRNKKVEQETKKKTRINRMKEQNGCKSTS